MVKVGVVALDRTKIKTKAALSANRTAGATTITGRCFVARKSEMGTGTMRTSPQSNIIPTLIVLAVPEGRILLDKDTEFIHVVRENN